VRVAWEESSQGRGGERRNIAELEATLGKWRGNPCELLPPPRVGSNDRHKREDEEEEEDKDGGGGNTSRLKIAGKKRLPTSRPGQPKGPA